MGPDRPFCQAFKYLWTRHDGKQVKSWTRRRTTQGVLKENDCGQRPEDRQQERPQAAVTAYMPDDRCRLGSDDVVIGLDLASAEHQAVALTAAGQRLTRFRIPHTRAGLEELLRRTTPAALGRAGGARVFAFEATGHLWEAVAYVLSALGASDTWWSIRWQPSGSARPGSSVARRRI